MVNKVLLDTNVVIGILNQQEWAFVYLLKIKRTLISVISIMELFGLAGMEKTKEEKINDLMGCELVTRNTKDFRGITGLRLIN